MNNQKQLVTALLMVAQDDDELLPEADTVWGDLKVDKGVLVCPTAGKKVANGYVYNNGIAGVALGEVKSPNAMPATADGVQRTTSLPGGTVYRNIAYSDIDYTNRHTNKLIVGFLDGHVERTSLAGLTTGPLVNVTAFTGLTFGTGGVVNTWGSTNLTTPVTLAGQGTPKPAFEVAGMNGKPCVVFNGANYMQAYLNQSWGTCGVVFATTQVGATPYLIDTHVNNPGIRMTAAGKITGGNHLAAWPLLTSPNAYNDGNPHLAIYTIGPQGSQLFVDGEKVASNTTACTAFADTQFDLGMSGFVGRIGAAFWYSTVLSADELTLLSNQLKVQFGI